MGSSFSTTRTPRVLIGDLSELSFIEQHFFSFSYAVLDSENPFIDRVSPSIGIKILDTKSDKYAPETCTGEEYLTEGTNDELLNPVCSANVIITEEGLISSLFSLLVTDKPYYFSQTFSQWRTFYGYENLFSCCLTEKRSIYIAPVDNFPEFIKEFEIKLDSYKHCLNFFTLLQTFGEIFFFGPDVHVLPAVNLFESNWNVKTRLHRTTGKKQYFVKDFFVQLKQQKPQDGYCIMGISWTDLYPTESLNFVLGEANNTTKSGIFCFGRFEPKSYDPDNPTDITEVDAKLLWRILKVFSHELCHLYGMQHCWYFACSMNESSSMAEAFSQPLFLCPVCLRKLQYVHEFDILKRYRRLLSFLTDLCVHYPSKEFRHSVIWLQKMIQYLESCDT